MEGSVVLDLSPWLILICFDHFPQPAELQDRTLMREQLEEEVGSAPPDVAEAAVSGYKKMKKLVYRVMETSFLVCRGCALKRENKLLMSGRKNI